MPIKVPPILRRFAEGLALESKKEILQFVRGYLDGRMKKSTPSDLVGAIRKGTPLLPSIKDKWRYKNVFGNLMRNKTARRIFEEEKKNIDYELVMKWLHEDRPDLWSIIQNWPGPQGRAWLTAQIEQIKREFLGIQPWTQPQAQQMPMVMAPKAPPSPKSPAIVEPPPASSPTPSASKWEHEVDPRFSISVPESPRTSKPEKSA